ncbi:MAG: DNA repair protein RadA [Calditrichia bacterium]
MAKPKVIYQCSNCGQQSPKWAGRCSECGHWNSFEEFREPSASASVKARTSVNQPVILSQIDTGDESRLHTGIAELDRVLGGGMVPASVILIAGDPGIGKSTLLLQMAASLHRQQNSVLYISGEESLRQIRGRAERLGIGDLQLPLMAETELENILYQIEQLTPRVVIVDSIQSIYSRQAGGAPGNMSQVRDCTAALFRAAKENNWSLFIVGHITKEGGIAGPKLLEHTVDVVIYFEGDNLNRYRILRSIKNRFGATREIGLFTMEANGLNGVENPSGIFLSGNKVPQSGSCVICSFEGTRPILAEVQALVSRSNYGMPQRTVSGFDQKRLALLLAILEKYGSVNFGYSDVFVKIAGGLRVNDPGIDLGVAMAVYSSLNNVLLQPDAIYIGEIGLNGDIRPVPQIERRIEESIKLGFRQLYIPPLEKEGSVSRKAGIKLIQHHHLSEMINNAAHPAGAQKGN